MSKSLTLLQELLPATLIPFLRCKKHYVLWCPLISPFLAVFATLCLLCTIHFPSSKPSFCCLFYSFSSHHFAAICNRVFPLSGMKIIHWIIAIPPTVTNKSTQRRTSHHLKIMILSSILISVIFHHLRGFNNICSVYLVWEKNDLLWPFSWFHPAKNRFFQIKCLFDECFERKL